MATDDARQRLQRELELAYQRGQLDATVRTVQDRLNELTTAMQDIQKNISTLTKNTITREEFDTLEVKVQSLSKWQWTMAGGLGALMALSQILPRVLDILRKP